VRWHAGTRLYRLQHQVCHWRRQRAEMHPPTSAGQQAVQHPAAVTQAHPRAAVGASQYNKVRQGHRDNGLIQAPDHGTSTYASWILGACRPNNDHRSQRRLASTLRLDQPLHRHGATQTAISADIRQGHRPVEVVSLSARRQFKTPSDANPHPVNGRTAIQAALWA
jgi:hypothetical protein